MKLFVIGAAGHVGQSLRDAASANRVTPGFRARPHVNLLRPHSVAVTIKAIRPDVVIDPAAHAAVEKAASKPDNAFAINRGKARAAAAATNELKISITHSSRFDAVHPQNGYGRSELEVRGSDGKFAAREPSNHLVYASDLSKLEIAEKLTQ
jgi:dTDP-4-dehydrorhamnose reductase